MKNIQTVSVSSKGQIVIPEEFREEINIEKGTNVLMIKQGRIIILMPENEVITELKDEFKDIDKMISLSLKDLWDNKEDDEVWIKYLK